MHDMQDEEEYLPYSALTRDILGCCFVVMKELGLGFLERFISRLQFEIEKLFEVKFRGAVVGRYSADLIPK